VRLPRVHSITASTIKDLVISLRIRGGVISTLWHNPSSS
jgi:hypothetical protein